MIEIYIEQDYMLKNWVEGLSDEAFYPWESPKKIQLKSVNPTFVTEQKKVSIRTYEFFKIMENKQKLMLFFIVFHH